MYVKFFKRLVDILFSLIGIIVLFPLFLTLAIIIRIDSKGSIFFKQKRVGINKTYFYIIKFRTMRIDTPSEIPTHMFSDPEQYITKVGKFLRKTSLDELFQLLNILFGEMSIVGPRPALWNQYDLISERDKYGVNDIKPGLTGLAQINGRDEIDIETKALFDAGYVRGISIMMDAKCFFVTVLKVIKRDGVVEGHKKPTSKIIDDNTKETL